MLNLSNIRSKADHIPLTANITAPTGTITRIKITIMSHPIILPRRLLDFPFTFYSSSQTEFLMHIYSNNVRTILPFLQLTFSRPGLTLL